MLLLDTHNGSFCHVEDPRTIKYAALSHVWDRGSQGELSYQDVRRVQDDVRIKRTQDPSLPEDEVLLRLSVKVREACERARNDGLERIWIDICCIDKVGDADISKALNSMYVWYSGAAVCYAFLADVDADEDASHLSSSFRRSIWFKRGWTLLELIAPPIVIFLARDWRRIGGKHSLAGVIEEVIGVDRDILLHRKPLSSASVAQRMSWASRRTTTRKEDEAYCLMGLFGISMPIIYGEGEKAFVRLQEYILRHIPDQSLFVWDELRDPRAHVSGILDDSPLALFATSPAAFLYSGNVRALSLPDFIDSIRVDSEKNSFSHRWSIPSFEISGYGIRLNLRHHTDFIFGSTGRIVPLACTEEPGTLLALMLRSVGRTYKEGIFTVGIHAHDPLGHMRRPGFEASFRRRWPPIAGNVGPEMSFVRVVVVPLPLRPGWEESQIHLPHLPSTVLVLLQLSRTHGRAIQPPPDQVADMYVGSQQIEIMLHPRSSVQLVAHGFTCTLSGGQILEVSRLDHSIALAFHVTGYTLHASYSASWQADGASSTPGEDWSDTATIVSGRPGPGRSGVGTRPLSSEGRPGEQTTVENWDPAVRPDASARMRIFPLTLPEAGPLERMRVTISRDSPGSAHYPALFTLMIDIIEPAPSVAGWREDDTDADTMYGETDAKSVNGEDLDGAGSSGRRRFRDIFRSR